VGQPIEKLASPGSDKLAIASITVCSLYVDLVSSFSSAEGLIAVVNKRLSHVGLRLVATDLC
jgi:hypothetical protein